MAIRGFLLFSFITFVNVILVESRGALNLESESGDISNGIVNTSVLNKKKDELDLAVGQPRQEDEDGVEGESISAAGTTGTGAAASSASSAVGTVAGIDFTGGLGAPVGQIAQNIVPDAQGVVVSILKAVQSPFDFISKSVDNYINPTTAPPRIMAVQPISSAVIPVQNITITTESADKSQSSAEEEEDEDGEQQQ